MLTSIETEEDLQKKVYTQVLEEITTDYHFDDLLFWLSDPQRASDFSNPIAEFFKVYGFVFEPLLAEIRAQQPHHALVEHWKTVEPLYRIAQERYLHLNHPFLKPPSFK